MRDDYQIGDQVLNKSDRGGRGVGIVIRVDKDEVLVNNVRPFTLRNAVASPEYAKVKTAEFLWNKCDIELDYRPEPKEREMKMDIYGIGVLVYNRITKEFGRVYENSGEGILVVDRVRYHNSPFNCPTDKLFHWPIGDVDRLSRDEGLAVHDEESKLTLAATIPTNKEITNALLDTLGAYENLREAIEESGGKIPIESLVEMTAPDLLHLLGRNNIKFVYVKPK